MEVTTHEATQILQQQANDATKSEQKRSKKNKSLQNVTEGTENVSTHSIATPILHEQETLRQGCKIVQKSGKSKTIVQK